jgi:alpha-2-macroglobulin
MRTLLAALHPRAWARFFRALVGDIRYTPPAWVGASVEGLTESMRRRPGAWAGLILISGASFLGYSLYADWWEKHRPRPKEVVQIRQAKGSLSLRNNELGQWADHQWKPSELHLNFDVGVSPFDAVGKAPSGVKLDPAVPGEWTWHNDCLLRFIPKQPWAPGQKLSIEYSGAVSQGVNLPQREWQLTLPTAPALEVRSEFYTDPRNPELHQGVFTLESKVPLGLAELQQHLKLEVFGKSPLFKDAQHFSVTGTPSGLTFYVRTAAITIPEKEDYLKLSLTPGVTSLHGGKPLGGSSGRVRVPDVTSGFNISSIRTDIVKTENGDPEQTLFIETSGYVRGSDLEQKLSLWSLPKDKPADANGPVARDFQWGSPIFYTPQVMAVAKRIPLKRVETEQAEGAPMASMHAFRIPPSQPLQVLAKIEENLQALGGFRMVKPMHELLTLPELTRELTIDSRGGLLALNGERKLSIKYRGVDHLRFTLARVPFAQLNHLARLTGGDFQSPYWKIDMDEHNVARVSREIRQVSLQNEYAAHYTSYDFGAALQTQDSNDPDASRGLFFLTAEAVKKRTEKLEAYEMNELPELRDWLLQDDSLREQRFVLITDLGVVLKRNADLSAHVFVQSVSKGEPVAAAQIMVLAKNGEFLMQTQTDAQGHAQIPDLSHHRHEKLPVCVIARLGNDVAFLPFDRDDRLLDLSRFDTGGVLASQHRALDGFLFTERGIYRPGDSVHISGIVKRRDWQGNIAGLPLVVDVYDAKNDVIDSQHVELPADGFFDVVVPTTTASATGGYTARLRIDFTKLQSVEDQEDQLLASTRFRVEEFQPDRMKLKLQFDPAMNTGWIKPGDVKATAELRTLFDAAAPKRRLQAKLMLDPGEFAFPVFTDYAFHNPLTPAKLDRFGAEAPDGSGRSVPLGEQKTDDAGKAVFDLGLQRFAESVFSLELIAEAFEPDGGRSVRATQSLLVAPQDYVIGWKADGDLSYVGKDVPRVVNWIGLSPELKPIAVQGLKQRLVRSRYVSVLTRQDSGSYAYVSTLKEDIQSSADLALPADGAQLTLPTAQAGDFRLELVNAQEQIVCVTPFSVVGAGDSNRSLERDAELQLKLAKTELAPGETLDFSLRAPFTGAGLVTIEREKVLSWHWIKQTTLDATHSIPLPKGLSGTAYVNVAFVRALDSPEVFTSPLSYATAPFQCDVDRRKMSIAVTAPSRMKPGDALRMSYQSSQPSRMVVYAVDEGILRVTDYELPQPLLHFDRKRALEVESQQLLDLIIPEFSILTRNKAFGGSSGGRMRLRMNPFQRRREAPVVFWSGIVESGPQSKELSYTVPDYFNGSIRVMAVAVNAEGIGTAQASTIVKGPLILTPNAPFHAAPGDSFIASLNVVNNTEGPAATSDIVVQATSSEHLSAEGKEQRISLAPGKETTLRFPVKVSATKLGGAELQWKVSAGAETATRSATLSVRPAAAFSTHLQSGYWRTATHEVPVKREMHEDFRQLEATVSTTPLGLARGLEAYLAAYPHGCSEQITSRAMAKLLLADEADFGMNKADAVRQVDYAFSLLRIRQNANGGFGYWSDSCAKEPEFLSIYVTSFLIEARDAGYAVPADLINGVRERLKQMARHKTASLDEADLQAQAIYWLTRMGEVTTNHLLNLRDVLDSQHKDAWQSHIGAAYLASTYMLLKQEKQGNGLMAQHLQGTSHKPNLSRWYGGWWSDPRSEDARRFALQCRHFPEVAGNFGYDEISVITEPMSRGFINTICSAQTILALKSYADLTKQRRPTAAALRSPCWPHPHWFLARCREAPLPAGSRQK